MAIRRCVGLLSLWVALVAVVVGVEVAQGETSPTAIVIVVDDHAEQSFSVSLDDFFEAFFGLKYSDLIDAPDELKGVIDTVAAAAEFVIGKVTGGLFSMLAEVARDQNGALSSTSTCVSDMLEGIADTLDQSQQTGEDPLPIFRRQFGENFIGNCLKEIAEPHYDQVVLLLDEQATFSNFKDTLEQLHADGYFIDVVWNLHGCGQGPYAHNNLRDAACPDGPYVAFADSFDSDGAFVQPYGPDDLATINGGDPLRLNAVYMVNCGGADFNDAWLQLGARAANGPEQLNYYTLISPMAFLLNFATRNMSIRDAAQDAYRFERAFFRGISYTVSIDLTWVPLCINCIWSFDIGLNYGDAMGKYLSLDVGLGQDPDRGVDHEGSSARATGGDTSTKKAALSEPIIAEPASLQIMNLSPGSGGPGTQVTVMGTGFRLASNLPLSAPASVVLFDGAAVDTQVESVTQLRFAVPEGAECGAHTVEVLNRAVLARPGRTPTGQTSNSLDFAVLCAVQPPPLTVLPQIDDLFPGNSGSAGTVVIVNGRGFTDQAWVTFAGERVETEFVDTTALRFTVPAQAACGLKFVQVRRKGTNPGAPDLQSNQVPFSVTAPCQGAGQIEFFNPQSQPRLSVGIRTTASFAVIVSESIELALDACPGVLITTASGATFSQAGVFSVELEQIPCTLPRSGQITATILASDSAGNLGEFSWTFERLQENQPPTVTVSFAPNPPDYHATIHLSAQGADADGDALTYQWYLNGSLQPADDETGTIPNANPGHYQVRVVVSDGQATAQAEVSFDVPQQTGNYLPAVTLGYTPQNPSAAQAIQFNAQASDPDGDTLSYQWFVGNTFQSNATSASVQWSQPVAGTHTVRVVVSDGHGGLAQAELQVTVASGPAGSPGPAPSPGPPSLLRALDVNGNGFIDDAEMRQAIAFHASGELVPEAGQRLDDCTLEWVIRIWTHNTPIGEAEGLDCGAFQSAGTSQNAVVSGARMPLIQTVANGALYRELRIQGAEVAWVQVEVFDLAGRLQLAQRSEGPRLGFELRDEFGRPFPNGVYLYVVTVADANGHVWRSNVRKISMMR